MWTFCLIRGLDTLSWSCRKAPFISSNLIFTCFVSDLFNFMQQFVFIMGQQRANGHPNQCHAEFKYLRLSIDQKVSVCITILMLFTLPPSEKTWRASRLAATVCKNITFVHSQKISLSIIIRKSEDIELNYVSNILLWALNLFCARQGALQF